ncbi:MAG TPA: hypothetical protein VJ023_15515 [Pyrinomonadaceae bacterium]|nr:hypothetical protein [Pyrinomonadaceae bacterium]
MVPAKVLEELKQLYESEERAIDLHKYTDRMFDMVFEIITADSFVAGVASKILDRETVTPEETAAISNPLLLESRRWLCDDGQTIDLQPYDEIHQVAISIERLRAKCKEVLEFSVVAPNC